MVRDQYYLVTEAKLISTSLASDCGMWFRLQMQIIEVSDTHKGDVTPDKSPIDQGTMIVTGIPVEPGDFLRVRLLYQLTTEDTVRLVLHCLSWEMEEIKRICKGVTKMMEKVVQPALSTSSRRRSSSMPGVPNFSQAVHFDEDM